MKAWRNLAVGFGISFIGSVPLGYLNVVGFEIFSLHGYARLFPYLIGVIAEESIVIYLTLAFAEKLAKGGKWVRTTEILSILFLLVLAAYFFFRQQGDEVKTPTYVHYSPFVAGAVLNAINFMQLPFWTGWNMYLINAKWIVINGRIKYLYILGALVGTLVGMLAFILGLHYLAQNVNGLSYYLMKFIIPLIFVGMALWQAYKFYEKYRND
ncbi:hypothetical protein HUK80_07560 [Flavobacterium sp. MAH-1]|uniref:Lysine transporter LysE n=1 Tax=Flavobacterium agri TaxID=2743471 RepID=A0A7Y8Y1I5_9FLAO|nr:hypothetical protein [Flavobacterium agri]NUY80743.1 hypothetical protein [Flavobacterium agri]NYA70767.1 hypothetical protein [Flavobacterium agri]